MPNMTISSAFRSVSYQATVAAALLLVAGAIVIGSIDGPGSSGASDLQSARPKQGVRQASSDHCLAGAKRASCVKSRGAADSCHLYACYTCGSDGLWGLSSTASAPCGALEIADPNGRLSTRASDPWPLLSKLGDADEP